MKKKDIMPGGHLFPIFWFELFGTALLIALILFIASLMKGNRTKKELLPPADTVPTIPASIVTTAPAGTTAPLPTADPAVVEKESLQHEILELFFDSGTSYGMLYRDGKLTSESFARVFYEEYGERIEASKVQIGDCATGNGISGICVGIYRGLPVYAYMSEYASYGKTPNGMCLGYSREQCDELFYGMYPVDFDAYYEGAEREEAEDEFPVRVTTIPENPWYATMTYQYGKYMSDVDADYLLAGMMHECLHANNQKVHRDKFEEFLSNLPHLQGFDGTYDLMVDSVKVKEDYTEVQVRFIPHDAPGIQPVGTWALTLYKEYQKFLPCGVDFASHPEVGFVKDKEITIKREDGQVTVEREEIIYGQTVDEDGKAIYRLDDGTVIYLE